MEANKREETLKSGKLYGLYRCGKRNELMKKVPRIDHPEKPDIISMVIVGILEYGPHPDIIRLMMQQCFGTENMKIPYGSKNMAMGQFLPIIAGRKLGGKIKDDTTVLLHAFYEFLDMPTEATRQMQKASDVRDLERYLSCETRIPVSYEEPVIRLLDADFLCQQNFLFAGIQQVKTGRHKEGKKYVDDYADQKIVESVRLIPGKPQLRQTSSVQDLGPQTRLEMYVMLKAAQNWAIENGYTDPDVLLMASYYYLSKNNDDDKHYSPDFFGTGGNVVTLKTRLGDIGVVDSTYEPQLRIFLSGTSVDPDKCLGCQSRALCRYKGITAPLKEGEKHLPNVLPQLSAAQAQAANALIGRIRVVATAGSGKTTAMAYRIVNLLKSGVAPEKIGCFTFTNASAAEMSERIKNYCRLAGVEADPETMTVSTIHSFGDSLLKKYYDVLGYTKPPVLINEIQRTKIVEQILSENVPIPALNDKYKNFYLDMFKAKGILELMKDYFGQILEGKPMTEFMRDNKMAYETAEAIFHMYGQYVRYKKDACLIEHSDQEHGVLRLLQIKPDLFDEVGIEHISVDEYQDTSQVQFRIILAMSQAKCAKSLFVVGDDDQSIYGFRDADVSLIQNFFQLMGGPGQDIRLMENRRSTANIVRFSDRVIAYNEERIPKNPVSVKGEGDMVEVLGFVNKKDEQEFIVNQATHLIRSGRAGNDIAILAPTNSELLEYAALLEANGVQCVSINPEPVLENPRVRGAVSLIQFLDGNSEYHGMLYTGIRDGKAPATEKEAEKAVKALQKETAVIKSVSDLFRMLAQLDPEKEDEIYQAFLEDVQTAKEDAIFLGKLHEVCEYILDYERFGKKETARREKEYPGVVLSTMHTAKGKEWPIVFVSVSKMHSKGLKQEEIPEKNRVLFVACTRAKEKLYVTGTEYAFSNAQDGEVQNLFLRECREASGLLRYAS